MRRPRVLVGLLIVAPLFIAAAGSEVDASCESPLLQIDSGREARRGDLVTVSGEAWGDTCYDVDTPPSGQGWLGRPSTSIVIRVEQRGESIVVARGNAEDDYSFVVNFVLPTELEPGTATVIGSVNSEEPSSAVDRLRVSSDAPLGAEASVVHFGPSRPPGFPLFEVVFVSILVGGILLMAVRIARARPENNDDKLRTVDARSLRVSLCPGTRSIR